MEQRILSDLLALTKRIGGLLSEVLDTSEQMLEALERRDEVVLRMYMDMREEPIRQLRVADQSLRDHRKGLKGQDAKRVEELFAEGAEGNSPDEKRLAAQVSANRRLYQQVMGLDRKLNRSIAHDKSIYQ